MRSKHALLERLEKSCVRWDNTVGRQVKSVYSSRHDLIAAFEDGSWTYHNDCEVYDLLEQSQLDDGNKNPFVKVGLATQAELAGYFQWCRSEEEALRERNRQREYESLKAEFE